MKQSYCTRCKEHGHRTDLCSVLDFIITKKDVDEAIKMYYSDDVGLVSKHEAHHSPFVAQTHREFIQEIKNRPL